MLRQVIPESSTRRDARGEASSWAWAIAARRPPAHPIVWTLREPSRNPVARFFAYLLVVLFTVPLSSLPAMAAPLPAPPLEASAIEDQLELRSVGALAGGH